MALGIEVAAQALGLQFVPLVQESYHLVCLKSALQDPAIVALRQVLQSAPWQEQLRAIAGYTPSQCGQVLSLRKVLPWWSFSGQKPAN